MEYSIEFKMTEGLSKKLQSIDVNEETVEALQKRNMILQHLWYWMDLIHNQNENDCGISLSAMEYNGADDRYEQTLTIKYDKACYEKTQRIRKQ